MDSSPLGLLTPELLFWILDFLDPQERSNFSTTCRHALLLAKKSDNETNTPLAELTQRRKLKLLAPGTLPLVPPLATLPTELIFQILDYMYPHEYSGLSCTSRGALSLVNQKLNTPEGRRLDPLGAYISRTGRFVKDNRVIWGALYDENGLPTFHGCENQPLPTEEDAEL